MVQMDIFRKISSINTCFMDLLLEIKRVQRYSGRRNGVMLIQEDMTFIFFLEFRLLWRQIQDVSLCVGKPGRRTGACSGKCMGNPGRQATQQIGDELQLQENEFNIANIIMPEIAS